MSKILDRIWPNEKTMKVEGDRIVTPGVVSGRSRAATRATIGSTGYNDTPKGWFSLEYMAELMPPIGIDKFLRMMMNDPIVGGLLLHMYYAMSRVKWDVKGKNDDFVMYQVEALKFPMEQIFFEMATSFSFGFFIGELIWDIVNGKVTLLDVEPRHQPSIQAINTKEKEVIQFSSDIGEAHIPYEKCLHHVFLTATRNPFGISLLRHLYKPYYYKISIEATEAVGLDRDLTGLPVMTAPEGFDFTAADPDSPNYQPQVEATLQWATEIVTNVRKDQLQGIVKPNGWTLDIIRGENRTAVPTTEIIMRYNTEMAAGLLENFMALGGAAARGSATSTHVHNFVTACEAYANFIGNSISRQIFKRMCAYNGKDEYPLMKTRITNFSVLSELGQYVERMVNSGAIMPNPTLEKAMLDFADLPPNDDGSGWNPDGTPKLPPKGSQNNLNSKGGNENA